MKFLFEIKNSPFIRCLIFKFWLFKFFVTSQTPITLSTLSLYKKTINSMGNHNSYAKMTPVDKFFFIWHIF